ncbi:hypothetical protein OsI_08271 [Oryza sativa Indica Group]|uniref:K+ potassium transporter integral membrane domain-containing protein n=1 Tax=Oryza sativa subsp. indica TaxID=39946 RepID=B8AG09_ORYSI|nr:hypothetical protein OsI_08271 [Oryza sativa Indica Group]
MVILVMLITAILLTLVMLIIWGTHVVLVALYFVPFLLLEATYVSAVCTKILRGGWVPFAVSVALVMVIGWYYGQQRKTEMRRLLAAMGAAEEAAASAAAAAAVPALFVGGRCRHPGALRRCCFSGLHLSGRLVLHLRESHAAFSSAFLVSTVISSGSTSKYEKLAHVIQHNTDWLCGDIMSAAIKDRRRLGRNMHEAGNTKGANGRHHQFCAS